MNRIIKFKAKSLGDGKWIEGDLLHRGKKTYIYSPHINERGFRVENEQVDPSTVCQFTGLKDKDGVEIWEHDEITYNNEIFEVVFKDGSFSISYWGGEEPLASFSVKDCITLMAFKNFGNKFDRKEGEK